MQQASIHQLLGIHLAKQSLQLNHRGIGQLFDNERLLAGRGHRAQGEVPSVADYIWQDGMGTSVKGVGAAEVYADNDVGGRGLMLS